MIDKDDSTIVAKAYIERVLGSDIYMENIDMEAIQWKAGENGSYEMLDEDEEPLKL